MIEPGYVQILAAALFALGFAVVLTRRNLFLLLMGVELMLNAANLSLVGFARTLPADAGLTGHIVPLFTIAAAAAEACVGLAMVICLVRGKDTVDADAWSAMKE